MFDCMTPCYIIDADVFSENMSAFQKAFSHYWEGSVSFGYSIKTNHTPAFLKLAQRLDMYAEAVSDDEYFASILSGYSPDRTILNGPQKSEELLMQLFSTECIINFDNMQDLLALKNFKEKGFTVKAKIGLRVNFDMESRCPGEMTAGPEVSRFGFCVENGDFAAAVDELHQLKIPVSGLHMHYSSKSRSQQIFKELAAMAARLLEKHQLKQELTFVDIGGGFFYGKNEFSHGKPSLDTYAQVIAEELKRTIDPNTVELILEPGASLISSAVNYYTKVINQRMIRDVKVLTVDGSRLHMDPFLTGRQIICDVLLFGTAQRSPVPVQFLCGSTCMENDRLSKLQDQQELVTGDVICCKFAGAYTMGFNSCFINLPPYVYQKQGDSIELVRDKNRGLLMQI